MTGDEVEVVDFGTLYLYRPLVDLKWSVNNADGTPVSEDEFGYLLRDLKTNQTWWVTDKYFEENYKYI